MSTTEPQLTTGVRIEDTKVAVNRATGQFTYEVHAKKSNAVVIFVTDSEDVYDAAARYEGTDDFVTLSYVRGRHNDKPALIVTDITLEERDDVAADLVEEVSRG